MSEIGEKHILFLIWRSCTFIVLGESSVSSCPSQLICDIADTFGLASHSLMDPASVLTRGDSVSAELSPPVAH